MRNILTDLIGILYPNICLICGENLLRNEEQICLKCLHDIPRTNYHLQPNNPVEKRFWGKVAIEHASSFFFFTKGSPFQKLLHELKYRNNKKIGEIMGKYAAGDLIANLALAEIDFIVPLPLHPKKKLKRGYNQSEMISIGIAAVFSKPIDTKTLTRTKETSTQTRKSVFERYENTIDTFEVVDKNAFRNKHILLVDDVLTTGSTIEAAILALNKCEGIRVSVFTLAVA